MFIGNKDCPMLYLPCSVNSCWSESSTKYSWSPAYWSPSIHDQHSNIQSSRGNHAKQTNLWLEQCTSRIKTRWKCFKKILRFAMNTQTRGSQKLDLEHEIYALNEISYSSFNRLTVALAYTLLDYEPNATWWIKSDVKRRRYVEIGLWMAKL